MAAALDMESRKADPQPCKIDTSSIVRNSLAEFKAATSSDLRKLQFVFDDHIRSKSVRVKHEKVAVLLCYWQGGDLHGVLQEVRIRREAVKPSSEHLVPGYVFIAVFAS